MAINHKKGYNTRMENLALNGTSKQKRKKFANIIKEMGVRNITLDDIAKGGKKAGFIDMIEKQSMTMDEVLVLQQYSKAIIDRDTKAAEFIRDSVGEKPSTQIDMSTDTKGLSMMSLDELRELKEALIAAQKKEC